MKLKKAISIYNDRHSEEKPAQGESFDELLSELTRNEDGESLEVPAQGGAAAAEPAAAASGEKKSERRVSLINSSSVIGALSTRRATLVRMALCGAMLLLCLFVPLPGKAALAIKIAAAVIIGYDLVIKAVTDILAKTYIGDTVPVLIAAVIYLCISRGTQAVITLIIFQAALLAYEYAAEHLRGSCEKGFELREVSPAIEGTLLDLGQGMTCPNDCVVIAGSGAADMSFITGDKTSVALSADSFIPAGTLLVRGALTAKVTATTEMSLASVTAREILNGARAETAAALHAETTSRIITLSSLAVAAVLMLVLPLMLTVPLTESLARVAAVIAVASPGSLLIAVPLTFFVGMSAARRLGIVFNKATDLEKTAAIKSIVFDKVGTLTGQNYIVSEIATDKMDAQTFLKVAAYAEAGSDDPIARAIVAAYGKEITGSLVENYTRFEGRGVSVTVDGIQILLGSQGFLAQQGISLPRLTNDALAVHMTVGGIYAGRIILSDYVVPTSGTAVSRLYDFGVERITMMSTDNRERDLAISKELGIDEYLAECPVSDRPRRVKEMRARIDSRSRLAYVSASLDADECFKAADVAISLSTINNPRLMELSDVSVMTGAPENVPTALGIALGVNSYVRLELLFTIVAKLLVLLLAGFGFVPLWLAVLIDAVAALGVVLDCCGALRLGGNVGYGDFLR